jgi:hypothetical protein
MIRETEARLCGRVVQDVEPDEPRVELLSFMSRAREVYASRRADV